MTGEWCGPTGQLSAHMLANLVERSRRCTAKQKKPTDTSAPLNDPWFEDSGATRAPEHDPSKPLDSDTRERRERTGIPKVIVAPPRYPVYRDRWHTKLARALIGLSVVGGLVASVGLTLY